MAFSNLIFGEQHHQICITKFASPNLRTQKIILENSGWNPPFFINNFLLFFSDSEKFHEMAAATESPPKQCFLLDDDGEFPPMSKAK